MKVNTSLLIDRLKSNILIGAAASRGTQMMRIASAERLNDTWQLTLIITECTFTPHVLIKDEEIFINETGEANVLDLTSSVFLVIRIRKDDGGVADYEWIAKILELPL